MSRSAEEEVAAHLNSEKSPSTWRHVFADLFADFLFADLVLMTFCFADFVLLVARMVAGRLEN